MVAEMIKKDYQVAACEDWDVISEDMPASTYEEEIKNDENKFKTCGKALECGHSCRGVEGEF